VFINKWVGYVSSLALLNTYEAVDQALPVLPNPDVWAGVDAVPKALRDPRDIGGGGDPDLRGGDAIDGALLALPSLNPNRDKQKTKSDFGDVHFSQESAKTLHHVAFDIRDQTLHHEWVICEHASAEFQLHFMARSKALAANSTKVIDANTVRERHLRYLH
jgi:hypothetical protein